MDIQRTLSPPPALLTAPWRALHTLWAFSRPHAMIGTALAVVVLYTLAAAAAGHHDWEVLLLTAAASLGMHLYVVGLNQLTDVEIDRINKPYLPLASGMLSWHGALAVVALCALLALAAAALRGPYLLATVSLILAIGTAYSLPPLRLKRSPFWAAACIATARAVVFNLGLALSFSAALGQQPRLSTPLLMLVAFMLGYVTVIALMKDIPDMEGDRRHQVLTLVLRLGARRTLRLCQAILLTCYVGVAAVALLVEAPGLSPTVLAGGHVLALGALWLRGRRLDVRDRQSIAAYYMFIWKLLYGEFALFWLACMGAMARTS